MAGRPARLQVDIVADASGVARGTKQAEGGFSKLGGSLKKFGGLHAAVMGAAGSAVGLFVLSTVKAASDLEQSMGAVGTVFGKSAKQIEGYSDTAATRLGLARSEYNTLAAAVGTSMQNMGKSQAEAAGLTDQLISRASDLAATFGGTTSEATQALGAAFRGEFDSVERLGISLRASDISAELAARGQSKLTGEALKNAQGQATLDLIMKQTNKTQGAFGRESNTLAGQQARLKAQFENVKAAIGARLTPVLVRLAQWLQTSVFPAFQRLSSFITSTVIPVYKSYLTPIIQGIQRAFAQVAEKVNSNKSSLDKLKPVISAIGSAIKTAAPIVGQVFGKAFELAGGAIGLVIDALGGLIGFVDTVIGKFNEMRDRIASVVDGIREKAAAIGDVVGKLPGLSLEVTPTISGPVVGPTGRLGPSLGILATAAAADPLAYSLGAGAGRSRLRATAGTTVNMPITINGALDPVAVARQLETVLRDATIRLGRTPAFGWSS